MHNKIISSPLSRSVWIKPKGGTTIQKISPRQLGTLFQGFRHTDTMEIHPEAEMPLALSLNSTQREMLHNEYSEASKKYGALIDSGFMAETYIAYIDDVFGWGLFANRPCKKGDYIGSYKGLIRLREPSINNAYFMQYEPSRLRRNDFVIDASTVGNETRFLNSSETPNIVASYVYHNDLFHVVFTVLADAIKPGEELRFNYQSGYFKHRGMQNI